MHTVDTSELQARYPRIADKITSMWGTRECRALLLDLLNDSREGSRAGFPMTIGKTLFLLLSVHDARFPQFEDAHAVPFAGARAQAGREDRDGDMAFKFLSAMAKIIVLVLIAGVIYTVYRKWSGQG